MTPGILISLAGALTVCLSMLVAVFLLTVKSPLRRANRYLAAFFLLTALDLSGWMAALFPTWVQELMVFRLPLGFLQMPMLCAYAQALYFPERSTAGYWKWGTVAALLSAISLGPRAFSANLAQGDGPAWLTRHLDMAANDVALHVQFYLCVGLLALILARYRKARSDGQRPDGPPSRWLLVIVVVSLTAHTLVLAKSAAWIGGFQETFPLLNQVVALVAVLVTFAMALTALTQQTLFVSPDTLIPRMRGAGKSRSSALDPEALARLEQFMKIHEPHLDPSLTIRALSRRIGMGQRELSLLINQQLGLHFFDFLNRHRIEKAAQMLADPTADHLSVLEIAHAVGFNSKSSFNAAFSKHRGETPSAYRARAKSPLRAGVTPRA